MNKKFGSIIAVYAIVAVIITIVFFCPFEKCAASYIEYVFTLIALALSCFITYYSLKKGDTLKSKVYGLPVMRVGLIYLAVQAAIALLLIVIGAFVEVAVWIPMVLSALALCVGAIGFIGADNARDIIEEQEAGDTRNTVPMTYFRLDIQSIVASCRDEELKPRLVKLADKFKYSDPVSKDELKDIEAKLEAEVKVLSQLVETNPAEAAAQVERVELMLEDRNRRCKATK